MARSRIRWVDSVLFSILLALGVVSHRLFHPLAFPLHDVGFNLRVMERLDEAGTLEKWVRVTREMRGERFYPMYWAYQQVLWTLGGRTLRFFWPFNIFLLFLLVLGIEAITRELGGIPFIGSILFITLPGAVENCVTIMKQELPLAVAEVWAVYFIIKDPKRWSIGAACFLLLLAGLLKETAVVSGMSLVVWGFILYFRREPFPKLKRVVFLASIPIFIGMIGFFSREKGLYTQAFKISITNFFNTGWLYLERIWPLFLLTPGVLITFFSNSRHGKPIAKPDSVLLLALMSASWMCIYFFWGLCQPRYLFVSFAFLCPLVSFTFSLGGAGRLPRLILLLGFMACLGILAWFSWNEIHARYYSDIVVEKTRKWIARQPRGTRCYFLFPETEVLEEMRDQVHFFENARDVKVVPALHGLTFRSWYRSLKLMALEPPLGMPFLVPYGKGIPRYMDRVFPVNDKWSEALDSAVKGLFGFVTGKEGDVFAGYDGMRVGFRIERFVKSFPVEWKYEEPVGLEEGREIGFQGILPLYYRDKRIRVVVIAKKPGADGKLVLLWNGDRFDFVGRKDTYEVALPKKLPPIKDEAKAALGIHTMSIKAEKGDFNVIRIVMQGE